MPKKDQSLANDFSFLDEATKSLLGYFVHTWYRHYLSVIAKNYSNLYAARMVKSLYEPNEMGRYTMLFDFGALDMEKLSYINGIYFYILAAHKGANFRLMHQHENKQVLYLRGYDFEGSVTTGGSVAMGFSSVDTMVFNNTLGSHLSQHCQLFKVLSPKDVYWETASAQRYFYGNYGDMIPLARARMCSVFLNALHWQKGVIDLLDRMDHYIVYVSSITESVLWELEQLDTKDRRKRTTVVFDDKAIKNKDKQQGMQNGIRHKFGADLIWSKEGLPSEQSVSELRDKLSKIFLLTSLDDFKKDINTHRSRIAESSSPLAPGARETMIDFHFHPSVDDTSLNELRDFSAEVESHINNMTEHCGIDCLPNFFNLVQLRVFMTLLIGEHFETGRALANYAAVMQGVQEYYASPEEKAGELSKEGRGRHLSMLSDHLEMARYTGLQMLSFGESHEFDDFRARGRAVFDKEFDQTKTAVDQFFTVVRQRFINRNLDSNLI